MSEEETQTDESTDLEKKIDQASEVVAVTASELDELDGAGAVGDPIGLNNLLEVPVRVTVQVGRTTMNLSELIKLGPGSVVTLDRESHEPVDILVQGKVVARGEIVTVDETYGVRITSVHAEGA